MESIGALLVALVGAGVGAYFAVLKSRKERLWLDRYETLRDIVLALGIVEARFSSSHMEQLGVSVMSGAESQRLSEEWPVAMNSLRKNLAKLRLLFHEKEISSLREAVADLHSAYTDLCHGEHIHFPELNEVVAVKADKAAEAAIAIGQRHCL
jgi:hypothetical protein